LRQGGGGGGVRREITKQITKNFRGVYFSPDGGGGHARLGRSEVKISEGYIFRPTGEGTSREITLCPPPPKKNVSQLRA
jgi:hypothetical protein